MFDTLVKPENHLAQVKAGLKQQLYDLSIQRGPTLKEVKDYVIYALKGKKLVGYHLPQKLADLGLIEHFNEQMMNNK